MTNFKLGVSLGRGGAPSFRAVLPGVPIVRRTAGNYMTGTGFGLYGSTNMVRAVICVPKPPFFSVTSTVWRTTPTGTGWLILANASAGSYTFSHFDTVGTGHPLSVTASEWPKLSILVFTYDGVNQRLYRDGSLVTSAAVANIQPSPPTNTEQLLAGTSSSWIAHFLGSDGVGAFLDDAGVLAWSKAAATAMLMRQNIVPWSGCEQWWNATDISNLAWTDRIAGLTANVSTASAGNFFKNSLPTSSVPRLL